MSAREFIKKYISTLPKGTALDLGCGVGNESLFLARNGFKVIAIDTKEQVIQNLSKTAQEENLNLSAQREDIQNFNFKENKYSMVLALHSLCFLQKSKAFSIIERIKESTLKDGIIVISLFTPNDAMFYKLKETSQEIEKGSFQKKDGGFFSFFTPEELKSGFNEWNILACEENEVKDKGHQGYPDPHSHYIVQIVAQKKET